MYTYLLLYLFLFFMLFFGDNNRSFAYDSYVGQFTGTDATINRTISNLVNSDSMHSACQCGLLVSLPMTVLIFLYRFCLQSRNSSCFVPTLLEYFKWNFTEVCDVCNDLVYSYFYTYWSRYFIYCTCLIEMLFIWESVISIAIKFWPSAIPKLKRSLIVLLVSIML